MINIAVDFGNSSAKVGIFTDDSLTSQHFFQTPEELKAFLSETPADNLVVSSVNASVDEVITWSVAANKKIAVTSALPLPVTIKYATPVTLGVDRIAAVCGAARMFPNRNCLVIDAGTCITFEFLDMHRTYHGGSISPGIRMRFAAMHQFTARLPLAEPVDDISLIGDSTQKCLQSGVMNGVSAEVAGIIQRYRALYPDLAVVMCGGDSKYFQIDHLSIVFVPELVLLGLNYILTNLL